MRIIFVLLITTCPAMAFGQVVPRITSRAATAMPLDSYSVENVPTPIFSQIPAAPLATTSNLFDNEKPVSRYKKSALQRIDISGGWLASTGNDINTSYLRTSVAAGMPIKGDLDNLIGVIPSFRVDFIDARREFDVPEELYETGLSFLWKKKINDRWSFLGQIQPSIRSDFSTSDNAVRVFGMALWTFQCVPKKLTVTMGALYLDRNDLPALPALGLNWTPNPRTKLELGLPRSRIAQRIAKNGTASETWTYISGLIGGNTWAVTRQSTGLTDELSLRDLRAMIGVEHIVDGGGGWFVEAGYSFFRKLEYESTAGTEIELSDGVVFQAGWAW